MKYKALVSFVGQISMAKGEEREISNKKLISDLLQAKYIEEIKEPTKIEEDTPIKKAKSKK